MRADWKCCGWSGCDYCGEEHAAGTCNGSCGKRGDALCPESCPECVGGYVQDPEANEEVRCPFCKGTGLRHDVVRPSA